MSLPYPARMNTVDAITFNTLLLPGEKPVFQNYVIAGGQTLKAGSVLGRITASGKLKLSASAAGDGSQTPIAVLNQALSTYDVDGTTALDMPMSVIVHGTVNASALVFGTGHTVASTREALRDGGIHVGNLTYSG